MRSKLRIKSLTFILCMVLGCLLWIHTGVESYANATADVVAGEGRIRESADKTSKTVASVKKGDKLDILSQTTDKDGYTWYKVRVDAQDNGYIRADLVTVSGGTVPTEQASSQSSSSDSSSSAQSSQSTANETVVAVTVSPTDVVSVKTNTQAKIRKGAGTTFDSAGGVAPGITMSVSGIATGSDGKNWYQVSYTDNNNTLNGFIREDLVEIVERMEAPVEEIVEEIPPVEEAPQPALESQDYYVKYIDNGSGEMDWYLFNNIKGTSMNLTQMLSVIEQIENKEMKEADQISNMKMIIIALAVILVILIVVVTILIFKLRDSYEYEEYEEEEEEEEEEEVAPVRETKRKAAVIVKAQEEAAPIRKQAPVKELPKRPSFKKERRAYEEEEAELEVKASKPENKSWQSKDFLELDDDMEFEFLDL